MSSGKNLPPSRVLQDDSTSTASPVPRIAFLGFCNSSVEIRKGHPAYWHRNIAGLTSTRVSFVYPLNLRGQRIVVAVYDLKVGDELSLVFRPTQVRKPFDLKIGVGSAIEETIEGELISRTEIQRGTPVPGWTLLVHTIDTDLGVLEPDTYQVFEVEGW